MTYPQWITSGSGRRLIVYSDDQLEAAMAEQPEQEYGLLPTPEEEPEPTPEPEEREENDLFNPPTAVESRMFKRGPGRPKGSKNKPK